jgi:carbon monoxide dehydrogenase subunit G
MPRREAKFAVSSSPQEVWRFIRDFESLCTCIPGVERIRRVDDRTAELTVKEKIGAVPLVMTLIAHVESEDPPHRLHATARAEHLTMAIDVSLRADGAATELASCFDVRGEGPLKPIVDRLFERRATERTAQFAECLGKRFSAEAAPRTAAAADGVARGWLGALRRWLSRLSRPSRPSS